MTTIDTQVKAETVTVEISYTVTEDRRVYLDIPAGEIFQAGYDPADPGAVAKYVGDLDGRGELPAVIGDYGYGIDAIDMAYDFDLSEVEVTERPLWAQPEAEEASLRATMNDCRRRLAELRRNRVTQ